MRVDAAILTVVIAFLLPLRLLSFVVRLNSGGSAGDLRRSFTAFAIVAALLAAIFALPRNHVGRARECAASVAVAGDGEEGFRREVRSEVEQLKLQLARLESFWENNPKSLDVKGGAVVEDVEVVKAMGLDIQSLIKEQQNIKESLSSSDSTIKSVENEVRILEDGSRKMNSDIYNMWSLANNTEKRVEALHSDVKKVNYYLNGKTLSQFKKYIVSEQLGLTGMLKNMGNTTRRRIEGGHVPPTCHGGAAPGHMGFTQGFHSVATASMSSSGSVEKLGEEFEGVGMEEEKTYGEETGCFCKCGCYKPIINPYIQGVMYPPKTVSFKDKVMEIKEEEALKKKRNLSRRLRKVKEAIHRHEVIQLGIPQCFRILDWRPISAPASCHQIKTSDATI